MSKAKKKRFKLPKLSKQAKIGIGLGIGLLAVVAVMAKGRGRVAPGIFELDFSDSLYQPRGIKNNNPGNIIYTNEPWEGKIPYDQNTDPGKKFEQFKRYVYGVRAMIKLLQNYTKTERTVRAIITRWSPGNPNYVTYVSQYLGVSPDTVLKSNKDTIKLLVQAIGNFENGSSPESPAIIDEVFEAAWTLI